MFTGKYPLRYSEINLTLWSMTVTPFQPIDTSLVPMNHTKSVTHQPRIICYLSLRSVTEMVMVCALQLVLGDIDSVKINDK